MGWPWRPGDTFLLSGCYKLYSYSWRTHPWPVDMLDMGWPWRPDNTFPHLDSIFSVGGLFPPLNTQVDMGWLWRPGDTFSLSGYYYNVYSYNWKILLIPEHRNWYRVTIKTRRYFALCLDFIKFILSVGGLFLPLETGWPWRWEDTFLMSG